MCGAKSRRAFGKTTKRACPLSAFENAKKLRGRGPNSLKSLLRVVLRVAGYRRNRIGQCSGGTANRNAVDKPNSIMPFSASMAPAQARPQAQLLDQASVTTSNANGRPSAYEEPDADNDAPPQI